MKHFIDAGTLRRLGMALALLVLLPLPALAATIYVDDGCTLEQAINSANAQTAEAQGVAQIGPCEKGDIGRADTIMLTDNVRSNGTLTIPAITSEVTIDGGGEAFIGVNNGGFSFSASDGDKLTIENARFTNQGSRSVVIVNVEGDVTFQNVDFYNSAGEGAGVRLTGSGGAKIREGVFRHNRLGSASVVSGSVDISRSSFYDNRGSGAGYVVNGATIRSSTIGHNHETAAGSFAVSGGRLFNVTVAHNSGGGVTGAAPIMNSILYGNSGLDCAASTLSAVNWIGRGTCAGGEKLYTGASPDIDDDLSGEDGDNRYFPLEEGADAAGRGEGCEFLDQPGNPFGPKPCDLGAHSIYVQGSGPRISAPVPTALPTPTPVPDQPVPTIEPVQGWVLYSDREDIKSNEVDASGVGIAHIVEMGFLTALDVWSEVGWGVTACHTDYSNGIFIFLDAAGMPREAVTWPTAPHIDGMTCTYIETPGTIVLLRADPWQEPPTPTPDPDAPVFGPLPLDDCQLITRDMVNLRAEEWGDVLNIIPYETELTAIESSEEFFKVTFEEQEGWVHRDWVTITAGDCGQGGGE